MEEHNRFAGQGSVLLDIGGDIGALVVTAPAAMDGVEIEIRPVGAASDELEHRHDHPHDHDHGHAHHPHVAVVGRPTVNGLSYTAVFPELSEGTYELYEKLGGPVKLVATVTGGAVQYANWV